MTLMTLVIPLFELLMGPCRKKNGLLQYKQDLWLVLSLLW